MRFNTGFNIFVKSLEFFAKVIDMMTKETVIGSSG
jgi:hypothetical protein